MKTTNTHEKKINSTWWEWLQAAGYITGVKLGQAGLGMPLEVLKLRKQDLSKELAKMSPPPSLPSGWKLAGDIIKEQGARKLWQGYPTVVGKMAAKDTFVRYPVLVIFPRKLEEQFPFLKEHLFLKKTITAGAAGVADIITATPFDRITNMQITHLQQTGESLSPIQILRQIPPEKLPTELYRGWKAASLGRAVGWGSFLLSDTAIKELFKQYNIDAAPGSPTLLLANIANGGILAAALTPLDVIRHQITGAKPLPTNNPVKAAKIIWAEQGLKAFKVGMPQRTIHSVMANIFLSNLIALGEKHSEKGR